MKREDFDYIYAEAQTCTYWWCGKPGVVLAYDDFAPEIAHWFCLACWDEYDEGFYHFLEIVEDHRIPTKSLAS